LAITSPPTIAGSAALFDTAVLNITCPVTPFSIPNELTYFLVTGTWYDVESPDPSANTNQPLYQIISAFVTFYPRVPLGFTAQIQDLDNGNGLGVNTAVALAPIGVRIMHGQLSTINRLDTPGIQLLANSPFIQSALETIDPLWLTQNNLSPGQLVYDVKFTNVVYASAAQLVSNFGFTASTDSSGVCITDPGVERLVYGGP
jgi:hypothetical protein